MIESVPKPNQQEGEDKSRQSRRGFLKTAATVGGSALVAGVVGKAAGERATKNFFEKTTGSLSDPAQELINLRHAEYENAVANGDPEAIELATGLITVYEEKLRENLKVQAALAERLLRSKPNKGTRGFGTRGFLENQLLFFKHEQELIVERVHSLKDPIYRYLENKKKGGAVEERKSFDDLSTMPESPKERHA